jgi:hypothetical protein
VGSSAQLKGASHTGSKVTVSLSPAISKTSALVALLTATQEILNPIGKNLHILVKISFILLFKTPGA